MGFSPCGDYNCRKFIDMLHSACNYIDNILIKQCYHYCNADVA